jgi:hypothetical protein
LKNSCRFATGTTRFAAATIASCLLIYMEACAR